MAFVKGQSGNPGGAPKRINRAEAQARREAEYAVSLNAKVMRDKTETIDRRLTAARWLVERGYGKAREYVDIELDAKHDHTVRELPSTDAWIAGLIGPGQEAPSKKSLPH
jgi:hypothetical protein